MRRDVLLMKRAQHQRGAHQPLPAAPALPRAVRRARAVRDRRVRPRDARLLPARLARQPERRPALGGRAASTACAARSSATRTTRASSCGRSATRAAAARNLSAMAAWARERDPSRPLHYEHDWSCRDVDVYSRMYAPHDEVDAIGRGGAARDPAGRPRRAAVHPLRVRARDGQRPGRAVGVPGAVRAPPALPGRLRVGVDRPRAAATPTARALRLRRRLRRAAARRQLRRRRPALPRPHALARPARVQEGDRAGADHGRRGRGCGSTNLHDFRDLSHLAFPWTLEEEGVAVAAGHARRRAAGRGRDRRGRAAGAAVDRAARAGSRCGRCSPPTSRGRPPATRSRGASSRSTPAPEPGVQGGGEAVAGGDVVSLGPGRFDAATGVLTAARRPRARRAAARRVARADRQRHRHARPGAARGRRGARLGLHRVRHRVLAVEPGPDGLVVRTRAGTAGSDARPAHDLRVGGRRGRAAPHRRRGARRGMDRSAAPAGPPARAARGPRPGRVVRARPGRGLPRHAPSGARRALRRLGRRAPDAVRAAAGERQPDRGAVGDAHRLIRRRPARGGPPAHRPDRAPLDERGPRRRDATRPSSSRATGSGSTSTTPSRGSARPPAARACSPQHRLEAEPTTFALRLSPVSRSRA